MRLWKKCVVTLFSLSCLGLFGGCVQNVNTGQLISGAANLGKAATVSEEELIAVSMQMRQAGDRASSVAPAGSKYAKRLDRLVKKHRQESGKQLNYKVYIESEVNANATPDGSIRVYSGLMDLMDDNELLYVIGHEIGHIVDGDSLDKMRMAYASSGLLTAATSVNNTAAAISDVGLGDLLLNVVNAQFSQQQELDADAYALNFLKTNKYNPKAAVSALRKLEKLSAGGGGLMASHPAPGDRANRIEEAIAKGTLPPVKKPM